MFKKNFKSTTLILSVIILTLAGACKKSSYNQLTDEEMQWLVFKNYETIRFTDGGVNTVNYFVKLREKAYQKDGDNYSEYTSAMIEQVNDTAALFLEDSRGELYILKSPTGLIVTFSWPHFPIKGVPLTSMIPTSATVGGILFTDVFVINGTGLTDIRNYNKKIWYSKSKGVIQIEDTAGVIWTRSF
jgi:hypothetical protein